MHCKVSGLVMKIKYDSYEYRVGSDLVARASKNSINDNFGGAWKGICYNVSSILTSHQGNK